MADGRQGKPAPHAATGGAWRSPYLGLVVTALLWAGNWIVGRSVYEDVPPVALSFWRWVIAAAILVPMVARVAWRERAVLRRELPRLIVFAALGIAAFNAMIYVGLRTTTAINGALLNSASPVFVIVLTWLGLGERAGWRQGIGIAVSLAGVVVIVSRGDLAILVGLRIGVGDAWVLAAILVWAVYTILLKRWPSELRPLTFLTATVTIGLVLMLPAYLWESANGARLVLSTRAVVGLLYLGTLASTLAYVCWIHGVRSAGAHRAALFLHLVPLFAALFAILLLDESVRLYHLAGLAFILSGIYIATAERPIWARI